MSEEERNERRRENARQMAVRREQLSEEERNQRRRQNAREMAERREQLSEEERYERRRRHAQQVAIVRANVREEVHEQRRRRVAVDNTFAILSGEMDVIPCSIGVRTPCVYCNAQLWRHETKWSNVCCGKGKIVLQKWTK